MKNIITLQKAFESALNRRGLLKQKGLTQSTVLNLRRNYAVGKVSLDRMREVVKLAGFTLAQPEMWTLPDHLND